MNHLEVYLADFACDIDFSFGHPEGFEKTGKQFFGKMIVAGSAHQYSSLVLKHRSVGDGPREGLW